MYLISKSLMGVASNLVFKRGGAVVKSMSPPLVGAVLVAATAMVYGRKVEAEEVRPASVIIANTSKYQERAVSSRLIAISATHFRFATLVSGQGKRDCAFRCVFVPATGACDEITNSTIYAIKLLTCSDPSSKTPPYPPPPLPSSPY